MSDKKIDYHFIEPWDKVQKKEMTPDYVNNFLHHVGLKCLTDGFTYFLAPDDPTKSHALPDLQRAGEGAIGRFVEVGIGRTQEVDAGVKRPPIVNEYFAGKSLRDCQYWEFFLEEVKKVRPGYFMEASKFYTRQRMVTILWGDEEPEEEEGEESIESGEKAALEEKEIRSPKDSFAYNFTQKNLLEGEGVSLEVNFVGKVRKTDLLSDTSKRVTTTSSDALPYFHVFPKFERVFDTNQRFLVIGDKAFLCSNLYIFLNNPRKHATFADYENL